jgi:phage terminase large subunit-like protein
MKRRGAYRHVVSADRAFAWHEWALDQDANVHNMAVVKRANPAPWQTTAALRRRHDSPSTTPWQWLRFACGIWTEGEEPWIEPQAWDVLFTRGVTIDPGADVWVGVDVGVRHDTTGIVILGRYGPGYAVKAHILRPPGGSKSLPLATVEQVVRDVCATYNVHAVGYDPWSFRRSAEILAADGAPMVEVPQSPEAMSIASATLYRMIHERLLAHDGDPDLRAQVLAGITKQTERGWRLQKDAQGRRPIDALIALAIAAHVTNLEADVTRPAFFTL